MPPRFILPAAGGGGGWRKKSLQNRKSLPQNSFVCLFILGKERENLSITVLNKLHKNCMLY